MPIEPPWPIIPPFIEAVVLLRAAQAALARAQVEAPSSAVVAALRDVDTALVALEATAPRPLA